MQEDLNQKSESITPVGRPEPPSGEPAPLGDSAPPGHLAQAVPVSPPLVSATAPNTAPNKVPNATPGTPSDDPFGLKAADDLLQNPKVKKYVGRASKIMVGFAILGCVVMIGAVTAINFLFNMIIPK